MIAAFLTAFYSFRVLFMTFHGRSRAEPHVLEHVHESPPVMTVPLILLAIGAACAGFALKPVFIGHAWQSFWGSSIFVLPGINPIARIETISAWLDPLPLVVGLLGIATAYVFYIVRVDIPVWLAERFRPIYLFLLNKWYFDELYDFLFVRPTMWLGRFLWKVGDASVIDGVPNGIAVLATDSSAEAVKLQSGSVAQYAFAMVIGVVVLIAVFLLVG